MTNFLNTKTSFPYPTIAVSSRGPRSRAGLMAYPEGKEINYWTRESSS